MDGKVEITTEEMDLLKQICEQMYSGFWAVLERNGQVPPTRETLMSGWIDKMWEDYQDFLCQPEP